MKDVKLDHLYFSHSLKIIIYDYYITIIKIFYNIKKIENIV